MTETMTSFRSISRQGRTTTTTTTTKAMKSTTGCHRDHLKFENVYDNDEGEDDIPPMDTLPDITTGSTTDDCSSASVITVECNNKNESAEAGCSVSNSHEQSQQSQQVQQSQLLQQQQQQQQQQCVYHIHIPMKGRTTDPGLLELDVAVSEFQQGVAAARRGNYSRAQELIGSAFLRSEHSIQHVQTLPSALLSDEYDNASIHVMEHSLFLKLLDHPHAELTVFLVMQLCAGAVLAGHPEEGRKRVNIGIKSGEKLLQLYDKNHWQEVDEYSVSHQKDHHNIVDAGDESTAISTATSTSSGIAANTANTANTGGRNVRNLFGTLQRWRIHRRQSALHSVVGNFLMSYTELDAALQTCPDVKHAPHVVCQVTYDLATLSMSCQLKPIGECFALFYQVITTAVGANAITYTSNSEQGLFDTYCLPLAYAYAAMIAAKNPAVLLPQTLIISHIDAFMFMEESDRCQLRYEELHTVQQQRQSLQQEPYGSEPKTMSPTVLDTNSVDRLKIKMEFLKSIGDPKQIMTWKLFDRHRQQQRNSHTTSTNNNIYTNPWTAKRQTRCLVCHKSNSQFQHQSKDDKNHKESSCNSINNNYNDNASVLLFKCIRCKNAFYCSKECQRKDWAIHKNYCKQLRG